MTHTYSIPLHFFYDCIIFLSRQAEQSGRDLAKVDMLTQLMGRDVDIRDQITPSPVPQKIY